MTPLADEYAVRAWFRKWGDPTDTDLYIPLDEMNEALEMLDALKKHTQPDGELTALLGHHPPSLFNYSRNMATETLQAAGTDFDVVETLSTAWLDGFHVGMCLAIILAKE